MPGAEEPGKACPGVRFAGGPGSHGGSLGESGGLWPSRPGSSAPRWTVAGGESSGRTAAVCSGRRGLGSRRAPGREAGAGGGPAAGRHGRGRGVRVRGPRDGEAPGPATAGQRAAREEAPDRDPRAISGPGSQLSKWLCSLRPLTARASVSPSALPSSWGRRSAVRTDGSLLNGGTGARPGGQEGTGNGHLE